MNELATETRFIRDIVKKDVVYLDKEKTVQEAATLMIDKGVGCIVVTDHDKPMGMITERDVICEIAGLGRPLNSLRLAVIASRPLITISMNETVADAAALMLKNNIRRLVVLKNKKLAGILTTKDLAAFLLRTRAGFTKRYLKLYHDRAVESKRY